MCIRDSVKTSSGALLTIINDILDFSKIEAGMLTIESIPCDLKTTVLESVRPLSLRAEEKQLRLRCDISPELPATFIADPVRLRQIIVNLVGNAIKFTERGEVVVNVSWQENRIERNMLQFSIRDTGIGIPPERIRHIFDAFTQADNSITRKYGGTGLGLSITRRLVELMGGQLTVDSQPGTGSCFRFTLPARVQNHRTVAQNVSSAGAVSNNTHTSAAIPKSNRGLDILLTEDNPINQKLALMLLERRGYRVTVAENGQKAVEALSRKKFAAVLMDLSLIHI